MPSWQSKLNTTFKNKKLINILLATYAQKYFNAASNLPKFTHSQRLYPDIAGCGMFVHIHYFAAFNTTIVASILPLIQKGTLSYAAGTSFASPTFAGTK